MEEEEGKEEHQQYGDDADAGSDGEEKEEEGKDAKEAQLAHEVAAARAEDEPEYSGHAEEQAVAASSAAGRLPPSSTAEVATPTPESEASAREASLVARLQAVEAQLEAERHASREARAALERQGDDLRRHAQAADAANEALRREKEALAHECARLARTAVAERTAMQQHAVSLAGQQRSLTECVNQWRERCLKAEAVVTRLQTMLREAQRGKASLVRTLSFGRGLHDHPCTSSPPTG